MSKLKYFLGISLIVLFAVACSSDDNPADSDNGGDSELSNKSGQPLPNFEGEDMYGVMATISYEFATIPGFPAAAITMGFAQFGTGVDAGTVTVNNNTIAKTTQSGTTFYVAPNPSNPTGTLSGVNFDGSAHNWSVSGSGSVPAVSGSVNSPRTYNVTSPAADAAVTKSNGLTVNWTGNGGAQNVLIVVADVSSSKYAYAEGLADDGNHTFSSSDLADISGDAMVQVVKYNYNVVSAGGKDYAIIAEIVKTVNVKVQ